MTPALTITNMTASGDAVTGPGVAFYMINGLPASCIGDLVSGAACSSGAITQTLPSTMNNIVNGLPQADLTSIVTGVSPTGAPVSTAVSVATNTAFMV